MRTWIPLAVIASLIALPASAGIRQGNGEVGFDLGFTNFDSEVSDDSGFYLDVRGGYHFTDWFELEGQLQAMVSDDVIDVGLGTFMVNGVFNFHPTEEIVPYVLVGIGQANLTFDTPFFEEVDDNGSAWQLAAGARFFVGASKKMAVRAELLQLTEKTFDESSSHTSLTVGLTWRIGH